MALSLTDTHQSGKQCCGTLHNFWCTLSHSQLLGVSTFLPLRINWAPPAEVHFPIAMLQLVLSDEPGFSLRLAPALPVLYQMLPTQVVGLVAYWSCQNMPLTLQLC